MVVESPNTDSTSGMCQSLDFHEHVTLLWIRYLAVCNLQSAICSTATLPELASCSTNTMFTNDCIPRIIAYRRCDMLVSLSLHQHRVACLTTDLSACGSHTVDMTFVPRAAVDSDFGNGRTIERASARDPSEQQAYWSFWKSGWLLRQQTLEL